MRHTIGSTLFAVLSLYSFSFATTISGLNRWAGRVAVRAIDTAITWFGLKAGIAAFTIIKPHTGIGRHFVG
jgi:hypothetical protein